MADAIVWISGASSGLGAALAASVPFGDARVIDISRSGGGPASEHVAADLTDPAAWAAVEAHLAAQLGAFDGRLALFIHSAGTVDPIGFAGEVDSGAYRRNVLLNAAAPQALGHAFLRGARAWGGDAQLVMITSGAARSVYEGWSSYCAGKAAVDQWVRVAGAEQTRRGGRCRVVAVTYGPLATRMQEQLRAADEQDFPRKEKFQSLYDRGELPEPEQAARAIWAALGRELDNGAVLDLRDSG